MTGAIQEWTIHIEGNKYWTVSGKQGGKLVVNEPVLCEAKNVGRSNQTTPEEQAAVEAQAKWTLKQESGYTTNPEAVDIAVWHMIKPTLAKEFKDYEHKLSWPLYSQPKFDGLRCIITRDGAWSRNWKPFVTLEHIREALAPVFEKHPNIVAFDGEVYNHDLKDDFNQVVSLVKQPKATEEDLARARDKIEYHVYDYVDTQEVPYEDRVKQLMVYITIAESQYIQHVDTQLIMDREELDRHYDLYLEGGYEGQMIRHPKMPYEHKRTSNLLKRKEFVDAEFPIIGYREGKGNRAGCIVLRCRNEGGQEFDCSVKGPVEYTRKLYQIGDSLIGKMATVKYQRLTPDGIPKFLTCIKFRDERGEELNLT